jgi:hypothetical protein
MNLRRHGHHDRPRCVPRIAGQMRTFAAANWDIRTKNSTSSGICSLAVLLLFPGGNAIPRAPVTSARAAAGRHLSKVTCRRCSKPPGAGCAFGPERPAWTPCGKSSSRRRGAKPVGHERGRRPRRPYSFGRGSSFRSHGRLPFASRSQGRSFGPLSRSELALARSILI